MNIIRTIILAIGNSLDSFAVMTCKGAMLSKIKKLKVLGIGILFGGWQVLVMVLGNSLTRYYLKKIGISTDSHSIHIIIMTLAVIIFCGIGLYMLWKGIRKKLINEKRQEDFDIGEILLLAIVTSLDTFLLGIGLAFLNMDLMDFIVPIILLNVASVILGIYTGYHHGYEQKTKAYALGGIMVLGVGLEVLSKLF